MSAVEETRITGGHSLFPVEKPEMCAYRSRGVSCGVGRVIECKDDRDTMECARCGKQWNVPCNFDEDFS